MPKGIMVENIPEWWRSHEYLSTNANDDTGGTRAHSQSPPRLLLPRHLCHGEGVGEVVRSYKIKQ